MESEAPDKDCYTLPNGECIAPDCSLHGPLEVKKPRSLQTSDPLWGTSGPDKKHFKLSGAAPTDAPSNGTVHRKDRNVCKKSSDHTHHYEIVVERVYRDFEMMVNQCSHCGKKKGFAYRVWTRPKPEWYLKMEARWKKK